MKKAKKKKHLDDMQIFAAGVYLSEFPKDVSWEKLLRLIEKEDDSVLIWEAVVNRGSKGVASLIQSTYECAQELFVCKSDLRKLINESEPEPNYLVLG